MRPFLSTDRGHKVECGISYSLQESQLRTKVQAACGAYIMLIKHKWCSFALINVNTTK